MMMMMMTMMMMTSLLVDILYFVLIMMHCSPICKGGDAEWYFYANAGGSLRIAIEDVASEMTVEVNKEPFATISKGNSNLTVPVRRAVVFSL